MSGESLDVASIRILVCGGRRYDDVDRLNATLDRLHAEQPIGCLIHGAAPGADRLAEAWARAKGVEVETYPADWKTYRASAGPIRNKLMLTLGRPDRFG